MVAACHVEYATGQRYVASMAGVFNYAVELGYLAESPVDAFRRSLARRERSKQGRAGVASKARPIEEREALARLVTEARAEGPIEHVMVLAMLDAHDCVEPQDYFEPLPWWGGIEAGRMLVHRGIEPMVLKMKPLAETERRGVVCEFFQGELGCSVFA